MLEASMGFGRLAIGNPNACGFARRDTEEAKPANKTGSNEIPV